MSDTEASEIARAWSEAEVTEKADIAGVADEDREKAEYEAAEREKAWAKAKAKQKAEISRFVSEASGKVESEAEARVTGKYYAAKIAAEEAADEIRSRAEAEISKRERADAEAEIN